MFRLISNNTIVRRPLRCLRSIDDVVLIDIYTNKTLAPTVSLNYQCCILRYGRTLDDVGLDECEKLHHCTRREIPSDRINVLTWLRRWAGVDAKLRKWQRYMRTCGLNVRQRSEVIALVRASVCVRASVLCN